MRIPQSLKGRPVVGLDLEKVGHGAQRAASGPAVDVKSSRSVEGSPRLQIVKSKIK